MTHREIEAKLLGSPERQHKLARKSTTALKAELIDLLSRHFEALSASVGEQKHLEIFDEYYDTPQYELRQRDAYFRIRRVGNVGSMSMTLKTGVKPTPGAIQIRGEVEAPVTEGQLRTIRESGFANAHTLFDLQDETTQAAARELLQLKPSVCILKLENDRVEMALEGRLAGKVCVDHVRYSSPDGEVRSTDESGNDFEVEIELNAETDTQSLSPLLDALGSVGFSPSVHSKMARGLRAIEKLRAVSEKQVILADYAKPQRDAGAIVESVDWIRYQLREMERSFEELVVVVVDLSGSVRFRLANESSSPLASLVRSRAHNDVCKLWIARFGGQVVKELGDGVLGVFSDKNKAWDAISAGVGILATVRELRNFSDHPVELSDLQTKVAISSGKVLRQATGPLDVYGIGVDLASRLLAFAKPGELLVAEELLSLEGSRLATMKDCETGPVEHKSTKEGKELRFRRIVPRVW